MTESVDPPINTLNAPFWDGAKAGCLVLPHCLATDRAFWPPSPVSPFATAGAVDWREVAPEGWLRASVAYERVFQQAFRPLAPYRIGQVALDAGVRLQAYLAGVDEGCAVGGRVRIGFRSIVGGAHPVPVVLRAAIS
jgi:uncharacterized OB-fold protein